MASPRTKLFLIALIPVGILAGLWLVAAATPSQEPGAAIEVSGPLPDISEPVLTEERLVSDLPSSGVTPDYYAGHVLVVNFWASWCGPCRKEQPHLETLSKEYHDDGVRFIGVNFRDDPAAAREYLREFDVTYPSVQDRDGKIAHRFGVPYLPATVLAGPDGQLRYRLLGAQEEPELRGFIEEILSEPAPPS
ncbi:MAG TPA: TlpA disulfide reductase family protein [Actinomycetota bacterium]|nr:TlpA disulfide reductase family protein [Actinomycetota bacterium]